MELNTRFRLNPEDKIALVGSGGKTTLMFQLARDFKSQVICTTTTHLALDQLSVADRHLVVNNISDLPDPSQEPSGDVLLVTGPQVETNRVEGPGPEVLSELTRLADLWHCPLIIEADGARKLPLKAPASYEPAIPDFVTAVITVIGLSGLGKPLTGEWVHRPELYSQLVDLPLEGILESKHLARAAISEQGGLKNIPPGARRILLFNQIDSFPNWKAFHSHMDEMLDCYDAVGFAVLLDEMVLEVHERIAGIVLAAGGSTRFGEPKQLLDWHGKPLISHVVEIAEAGGLSPVLVVTGADHDTVAEVLSGGEAQVVCNPAWAGGQSTSVKAGVEALPSKVGGVVFLLVDQPLIPPQLIQKLIQAHQRGPSAIILPRVQGRGGNPVLFDKQVFPSLKQLGGDMGGRALFDSFPTRYINWEDSNSQLDIDTPEDYQKIRFSQP